MKKQSKEKLFMLGLTVGLILIALSATYAFFSYTRAGTTENTIKSGSITFLYDELNQEGNSIAITDAMPMTDTEGKAQENYFDFKIVSTVSSANSIPYDITLRQKDGTDNIGNIVKVYLSKITAYNAAVNLENQVELSTFSNLSNVTHNGYTEKQLHRDIVPAGSSSYTQFYRLKMWIDNDAPLTNDTMNKTFTVMVNVYANGHALDANSSAATVNSVSVGGNALSVVSTSNGIDYYQTTLPEGPTQTTLSVDTGDYDRVTITKTQSDYQTPIAQSNNITRLSQTSTKTVSLTDGDNYFKIVATSEDGTDSKEIHLRIVSGVKIVCTLISGNALERGSKYACNPGDDVERNFYILSVDDNNDTVNLILDRNITQGTSYANMNWNSAINYFTTGDGLSIKNSWVDVISVDFPSAQEIADAAGITNWDYNTASSSNWSYFGVNSTSNPGSSVKSQYSWLYNYTRNCSSYGCDSATSLGNSEAYGYWTKDAVYNDASRAWHVDMSGGLGCPLKSDSSDGVRPIITINKYGLQ